MSDIYTRKLFCLIRWALYITSICFLIAGNGRFGVFSLACAIILTGGRYRYHLSLAKRYKWFGIASVAYYVFLFIFVIVIKGKVFDYPAFVLFFVLPFIPEFINFEVREYRGR